MNTFIKKIIVVIFIISPVLSFAGEKEEVTRFVIDPDVTYQVMDNFSASDGWSIQHVGLWEDKKVNQIADWLFSTENDKQGKPKGIGLSLWRFNIGAGSMEQGEASQIATNLTRSECFLLPDGTYDWNKQKGQRKFLQLAKERGVSQFLGFILSAPVYWTRNGLATNTGREGASFNLQEDKYDDFARFTADVIQGMEKHENIKLNYVCPFNEPDGHWNWVGTKQEGTPATNKEIARTARELNQEFIRRGIDTEILLTESFDYNCLFRTHPMTGADRGYQIQSFFSPDSSTTYVGDLLHVAKRMVGHSYWTNTPLSDLRNIRKELGKTLNDYNLGFWQTEFCIMGNDDELDRGWKKDLTMKTALYVARIIHHDIVYANASAWQWWCSVITSDYKGGLVYSDANDDLTDGTVQDSKLMWALGNYSRFVRPGAVRLGIAAYNSFGKVVEDGSTDQLSLMVSAYKNVDNVPVIVAINYSDVEKEVSVDYAQSDVVSAWQPYITSDKKGDDLNPIKKIKYGTKIVIPAKSIITYVGLK